MPRPLRIGINALYLIPGGVGGTEIYLTSLIQAVSCIDQRNDYFVYVNAETVAGGIAFPERFHVVHCNVKARIRPWRIFWEQIFLPWRLRRHRIEVLLNPGFTAPVLPCCPMVTVFHDLQHKRHPEFFRWFELPFWNLFLWLSVVRSRAIVAVSQATARDLDRYYPGTGARTTVIHHGVDPEFFRIGERRGAAGSSTDKYLLVVSTLHPHKNLGRVLEAFANFRQSHPDFRLVVAGLKGFASEQLEARRRELGLEDSVRFTGWIPRSELYDLFERTTAFIAASEFEGFGMPVVEALAAGIPSACSAIPPFDEITGSAAVRFDPGSVEAIAAAMAVAGCDQEFRCRARPAGMEQGRRFDWKETARLTLRELERLAAS
jgi:glycosyltransferase involved in cell wall biosynthesis